MGQRQNRGVSQACIPYKGAEAQLLGSCQLPPAQSQELQGQDWPQAPKQMLAKAACPPWL